MLACQRRYVKYELLVLASSELETLKKRLLPESLLASDSLTVQPQNCTVGLSVAAVLDNDR